ncbi:hypothetical protein CSOJ01_11036 [Colletotrichum sojae]|uniref:Uncharacterized protein n=1 Tax=Colletotrichum sojae TaxID=2175907 RepID=A0A8H6MPD1_9PEZI|nr:hypothetical protein CSOJ01_11036 [Colletotrichum sojae]
MKVFKITGAQSSAFPKSGNCASFRTDVTYWDRYADRFRAAGINTARLDMLLTNTGMTDRTSAAPTSGYSSVPCDTKLAINFTPRNSNAPKASDVVTPNITVVLP